MSSRATGSFDVLVLGGGPAGCAAATLLAGHHHSVGLVRPLAPSTPRLVESIPPSAWRILDELGFSPAIERAAFRANRGNTVWWAGETRDETFTDARGGFHADRSGLEAAFATATAGAGATLFEGALARTAEQTPEGWQVRCERPGAGTLELRAPWIVDATGRHGFMARGEKRRSDRNTNTVALVGIWRAGAGGWPEDDAHRALGESYPEGWAWSLPLDDELRCVAAMVEGRAAKSGRDIATMLMGELTKTRHLDPARHGATLDGPAWACPASLYRAARFARPGLVLAGDAGSFIDPLSSFGVKKALSSGWLAGIVVRTALVDPAAAETALEFYDRREADVYRRYRSLSATFCERAAGVYGTDYWTKRARAALRVGGQDASPTADPDRVAPEVPESDVRRAFEVIRSRASLDAIPGASLRRVQAAGIEGHRIALRDHLASDAFPEGLRYVRGVDLHGLVVAAPGHAEVPDAWAAYNGIAPPVALPDYLTALATAFAAGLLEHAAP